ncbi:MAG: MotA/TolQ/ExbB proton channel family protein [Firmicutes bacterium]|nr:MotA/TolQ/ExbB proton channel family protein [Bacillota bacterium]
MNPAIKIQADKREIYMDLATIIGLIFAVACIILALALVHANFASYWSLDALLIVFGGTTGAALAGVTMKHGIGAIRSIIDCIKPPKIEWESTIKRFTDLATIARRDGVIFLQNRIQDQGNDLIKSGLQLIVDGADSDILFMVIGTKIQLKKQEEKVSTDLFTEMGAYAPGFGLLGTVCGLVMVLGNLSEPEKLGAGIAQAFLTTLYGISLSNLVFMPLSVKIRHNNAEKSKFYEMILTGLQSILEGDNPLLMEEKLKAFLPPAEEKKTLSTGKDKKFKKVTKDGKAKYEKEISTEAAR